jgi:hypothetical protein
VTCALHHGAVPLIRRRPELLALQVPRLRGSTFPTRHQVGRQSFASSALYRMGYAEAFTLEAHDVVDPLLEQVLPRLPLHASPQDQPYLRRVCAAAAQIGAGIGIVERRTARHAEASTDRWHAGALLEAVEELPMMDSHQHDVAVYLLHCGYYLARSGAASLPTLLEELGDPS